MYTDIKKKYSWFCFSYAMFLVAMEVAGILIKLVLNKGIKINAEVGHTIVSCLNYILGLAPIWLIGFPVALLFANRLPVQRPEKNTIKPIKLVSFYAMITFFMIAANVIGLIITFVIEKIFNITIENTTIDMINKQEVIPSIIFAVILGPILEEFSFRKVLVDRLGQYNKKYTIILSGVMFGLFHRNLYQFFYATVIGIFFAYIYTISGKIRYTIILHMCINFVHGIIPLVIMKHLDMDKINSISEISTITPETEKQILALYSNPAFLLLMLYSFAIFAMVAVGLVLWILNMKRIKVDDTESPLPSNGAAKVVFLNVGFILFTVLIVGITIYTMVGA